MKSLVWPRLDVDYAIGPYRATWSILTPNCPGQPAENMYCYNTCTTSSPFSEAAQMKFLCLVRDKLIQAETI